MKNNPTVDERLENLPPDLQGITRELIAVEGTNTPGAHESIYHDAVGNLVNDPPAEVHKSMKKVKLG
jgi:hypothetical protein